MKKIIFLSIIFWTLSSCFLKNDQKRIPEVASGQITRIDKLESDFVSGRIIDIWTPHNFDPDKNYPVLYMHDGQMLFDSTITWNKQEWGVDEVVGDLIKEEIIDPCIVVGIHNGGNGRHTEYFPQKPFEKLKKTLFDNQKWQGEKATRKKIKSFKADSDDYLKFLVEELKPYVDQNFPTLPRKENTYIVGSSMGGLISMYALCEYPEVFGHAACLSTHWPGLDIQGHNPIPGAFVDYLNHHLPDPNSHKIYFDFGTETLDSLYAPYQQMVDGAMMMNGWSKSNWLTKRFEGEDHSERSWNKRLHIPLVFLMKE